MSKTSESTTPPARELNFGYQQWVRDVQLGIQNLMLHGLRSLLTMLGMIFGVAAVVAMLSIGAGARTRVREALVEQRFQTQRGDFLDARLNGQDADFLVGRFAFQ